MIRLYNTLKNKIEEFVPLNGKTINMYVCGPTVYNDIHIGNARPLVFYDALRRFFEYVGYKVVFVSNITDIDDRIIAKSIEKKISEKELTAYYIKRYTSVYKKLNSKAPTFAPRATEYILEMINYIKNLVDTGYAYITDSGVYFKTSSLENYGELSNRKLNNSLESVRIENSKSKDNAYDFALWKITGEGIKFNSPFGEGRPGWHTECVVMIDSIFGKEIDIHGGGIDLVFPHHENENAQACASHKHLSSFWVHVNALNMGDTKMSKSLGNIIFAKDLIKEYNPLALRMLLLSTNYRTPISYSKDLIIQYQKEIDKIYKTLRNKKLQLKYENISTKQTLCSILDSFILELSNDFNSANAISIIIETNKNINKEKDLLKIASLVNTEIVMLKILGLYKNIIINKNIINVYNKYIEARNAQDFEASDVFRNALGIAGFL
ncbi:MAG: cysteine--tRNA ligase [Acholeplasmatales bacterium]|jgi:cysteinyl-tRNA synthetase|nr:cysteine--tRNA ligase [Acholeplasmatales bacterium]